MKNQVQDFKPGIYAHYKSTDTDKRYYQVLGVARNTETNELYALYIPLYVIPEHTGVRFQCRPLSMFLEKVHYHGKTTPRFKYLGQAI